MTKLLQNQLRTNVDYFFPSYTDCTNFFIYIDDRWTREKERERKGSKGERINSRIEEREKEKKRGDVKHVFCGVENTWFVKASWHLFFLFFLMTRQKQAVKFVYTSSMQGSLREERINSFLCIMSCK